MIESEKVLEKKLGQAVKTRKGLSIKLLSTHMFGLPDRMVLLPGGIIFFVEVKTTKKKPTKIQLYVHKQLIALGFRVYILDKAEQIENYFQ